MKLTGLDLNLLVAFEVLLEERSVSGAARRLGLGQPGMSATLGRLRLLLKDEVFTRAGGEMRPTAKALHLAPGITAALAQLRLSLEEAIGFEPATARRGFRIGATDYTAMVLLPALMALIRREAPGVDVEVAGYEKGDVAGMLERGEVDIATGVFPHPPERAVVTPLFQERFVAVARAGHPAIVDGVIGAADFAALPHALITTRRDATGVIDRVLAAQGLHRRVALTVPYALALPAVLEATDLVAAVPSRLADRIIGGSRLQRFALPVAAAEWTVVMLWQASGRSDPALAWLRRVVVAIAAQGDAAAAATR